MSISVDKPKMTGIKPLQAIPYSEKDENWRKQNIEYYIQSTAFRSLGSDSTDNLKDPAVWYKIYNNDIDETIFEYVKNPLNATKEIYKKFPARIRNYNIIRPTIDLLIGEWSKRPFKFDVINTDGEGMMNSYLDAKLETFKGSITDMIVAEIEKAKGSKIKPEEIPNPALVLDDFNTNYKDLVAIKGYKALKILEGDLRLKETFKDLFKDWAIAGTVTTLKGVKRSDIDYQRLSPLWVRVEESTHTKNFEDRSFAVAKFRVTTADLVDMFYEDLTKADITAIEANEGTNRQRFYDFYSKGTKDGEYRDKHDLYYCTWKSRKQFGILSYNDPTTGEPQTLQVDENYPVDKEAGESVEWLWGNEVWGGWRINDNKYLAIEPISVQRNEMNNFSSCKLPVNGRNFSDTEAKNISVLSLGIPYQLMYIIINYRIELTIQKSRGKIAVLDQATVAGSTDDGEERTLYYAEALGYLLLDRSNPDVDRTWNQYSVLDLSLYEYLKELISIAQFYKDGWEEILGINRQRKGATTASDGLGATQEAIFRSSIVSDIIFSTFDEFVQSELQGLLDLSKFAWLEGKIAQFRTDEGKMELFSIDSEDYVTSSMGVFVDIASMLQDKLDLLKQQVNAIAQRKEVKLSTLADMIFTDSYAELKAKLKRAEEIEMEIAKQSQESENEKQIEIEKIKKDYMQFDHMLELERQDAEWDRRDNNEYIKAELTTPVAEGEVVDIAGIEKNATERLKLMQKENNDSRKLSNEREKLKQDKEIAIMKDATEQKKIAASLKNKVVGEK